MGNSTEDYLDNLLKQAIAMDEGDYEIEPEPDDLIQDFIGGAELNIPEVDASFNSNDNTAEAGKVVIADLDSDLDVGFDFNSISEPISDENFDELSDGNSDTDSIFADIDKMLEEKAAAAEISESDLSAQEDVMEENISESDLSEQENVVDENIAEWITESPEKAAEEPADIQNDSEQSVLTEMFENTDVIAAEDNLNDIPDAISEEIPATDDGMDDLMGSLGELDSIFSNIGSETDLSSIDENGSMILSDNMEMPSESSDDMDLDALLSDLGSEDEELSEIGSLLDKDANSEIVDAAESSFLTDDNEMGEVDIDSLLDEEIPTESKKDKKRRKKEAKAEAKRAKKLSKQNGENGENPDADTKKEGFFSKLFAVFGEDEDNPEGDNVFELSAVDLATEGAIENEAILDELDELGEEQGKGKKKKKKDKKKKGKGDDSEGEESDSKKKKKEKKEKKEKKKKEPGPPLKKLPVKKIIVITIFIFSIGVVVVAFSYLYPYSKDMSAAKKHYVTGNYQETYKYLHGHKLTEEDQELYDKTIILLKLQRQLDSYRNYMKMGMKPEAMNALIQGVDAMDTYADKANELGIMDEYSRIASSIVLELQNTFGLDANVAREWIVDEGTAGYMRNIYDFLGEKPSKDSVSDDFGKSTYTPDIQIIVESENEDNEAEEQL